MKNISIGIMQGRLTPPKGRGIQFFPFEEWEDEFGKAAKLGFDEIEFIFDLDRYKETPLWSATGRRKIKKLIRKSGVKVNHICADFFMRRPFFRNDKKIIADNIKVLKKLIKYSSEIGARNIEIPILDNGSLKTSLERKQFVAAVKSCLSMARKHKINIGIESDLKAGDLVDLIGQFEGFKIHIVYDSGNSSSLGYDCSEEMSRFGHLIGNVHIKDRVKGGSTVALGTGSANFNHLFEGLKEKKYKGSLILQAARGEDGKEEETLLRYVDFVNNYLDKHKLV